LAQKIKFDRLFLRHVSCIRKQQSVFHVMSLKQENIDRLNPEQIRNLAIRLREENPGLDDEVILNCILRNLLDNKTIQLESDKLPLIDTSPYYKKWNHSLYKRTKRARGEQLRPSKEEFLDSYNYNTSHLTPKYSDKKCDYLYNYINTYMWEEIRRLGALQFWLQHKPKTLASEGTIKTDVWLTCQDNHGLEAMIYDMWGIKNENNNYIPTQEIKIILGMI
jgi:hypothetical protein